MKISLSVTTEIFELPSMSSFDYLSQAIQPTLGEAFTKYILDTTEDGYKAQAFANDVEILCKLQS